MKVASGYQPTVPFLHPLACTLALRLLAFSLAPQVVPTGARQGDRRGRKTLAKAHEAPLPDGLTPHKLRHTFASILVALGVAPGSMMDQLEHADPAFTLRIYRHGMRRDPAAKRRLRALVERDASRAINTVAQTRHLGREKAVAERKTLALLTQSRHHTPQTTHEHKRSAPCPRQESNLDLPLRRTKDGAVGLGESLGVATGLGDCRAWRSSAIRRDWAGFRQGFEATA
jgi:hypothetical protein